MNYDTESLTDVTALLRDSVFASPPGVALSRGPHGLRLIVTRPYRAGEVIYESPWWTVPDEDHEFMAVVIVNNRPEPVTITRMHSVRYDDTRSLDIPGCFMNHSCDPSSYTRDIVHPGEQFASTYEQIATRDLAPGDEITCDYTLFDWDCDGHTFECTCGSANCYGRVAGFVALPRDLQERLAPFTLYETERMWKETKISGLTAGQATDPSGG